MNITTVYMKRTDKEGRVTFTQHRVWDADRFFAMRHAESAKEGGKASTEQITHGDYRAGVKPRHQ